MEHVEGFEPSTFAMARRRSPTELHMRLKFLRGGSLGFVSQGPTYDRSGDLVTRERLLLILLRTRFPKRAAGMTLRRHAAMFTKRTS